MAIKIKQKIFAHLPKLSKRLEPVMVGICVFGIAGFSLLAVAAAQPSAVNTPATDKKISKHKPTPAKVAVVVKPVVTPPPVTTPAPTPAPVVHSAPPVTSPESKVEPTVTPSPSSSVTNLTPTSSPPASVPSTSSTPSSTSSTPATTTGYASTNWSGYLAANGSFSAVAGSWVAPKVSGNGTSVSADATWIGIGGVSSSDLIQIGTENTVQANGQVSSAAFYELLPAYSQPVPGVSVTPGDSMSASISEVSSGEWLMTITDNTNGQTFSKTVAYSSSNSSAEWIEEDPSYSRYRQVPFDNFGSVDFTSATTSENGTSLDLSSSSAQPVTMVNDANDPVATPSAITSGGGGFSVTQDTP